jgi:hypothetical protein
MKTQTIYVYLLDEGTDVWAPVDAEHISEDVYRILGGRSEVENAQFAPGTLVRCRPQTLSGGKVLLAFERSL